MKTGKAFVYIAVSLDGYIARENDDIDWLSSVEKSGEDYGYAAFMKNIDTVMMGRKTYDKVLTLGTEFWHQGKDCYVISRTQTGNTDHVQFYGGDLETLVTEQKAKGKNVFVDGGAEVVNELMKLDQFEAYIISILPIFLGSGIRLFKDGRPELALELVHSTSFDTGLVQLHYRRVADVLQ